jgi:hypothetical protein
MLGEVTCTADLVCDKKDCKARVTVEVTPSLGSYYGDLDDYPSIEYDIDDMPAGWSRKVVWRSGTKYYCPEHKPGKK